MMMTKVASVATVKAALLIALVAASIDAYAQPLPTGFSFEILSPGGATGGPPTCFCIAPDGRVFIGTQNGQVRIWKEGIGVLPTPFHSFEVEYVAEAGLLGMALDPDFDTNGFVYVHYIAQSFSPQRISRIQASQTNPDVAAPESETPLFESHYETGTIHNAGCLRLGLDGKLYFSIGDKGDLGSQSLETPLGKILRINRDGTIPADNPTSFDGVTGTTSGTNRAIWAIGLRNPFRFAFQPGTGRIFINDVGGSQFEEINEGGPGRNYGYPLTEGDFDSVDFPEFMRPVRANSHQPVPNGVWGSVILAGMFYNPDVCTLPPDYWGDYFFSDFSGFCRLDTETLNAEFITHQLLIRVVDMHTDNQGRILTIGHPQGWLIRLEYTDPLPPVVVRQPEPQILCEDEQATLNLVVSASLPITYQWQRNGIPVLDSAGVSGAQTRELTIDTLQPAQAGEYTCVIQNAHGQTQSTPVVVSVGPAASGYNGAFIQDFVDAVVSNSQEASDLCRFDFDASGNIDAADVNPFVAAALGS